MTVTRTPPRTRGIRTTYHGTNFRSRLEARWAAFFDVIEWPWIYEPVDAEGYIPDFLVTGPASFLVEVGPCEFLSDFSAKAEKSLTAFTAAESQARPTLIVGLAPDLPGDGVSTTVGYLTNDDWGSGTSVAGWARCGDCGRLGIFHPIGSYMLRPCGHWDGDNHLIPITNAELFDFWATAGNRVQWRR